MGGVSDPISVSPVPPEGSGACGMEQQGRLGREAGGFPSCFVAQEKYLTASMSF